MYQQELGRFMSRDALSEDGVAVLYPVPDMRTLHPAGHYAHPYSYVGNSPLTAVDPSGLVTVKFIEISPGCDGKQKDLAKKAVEGACQRVKTAERCLPDELRDCVEKMCQGTIAVFCVSKCDTDICGIAHTVNKDLKDVQTPAHKKICESAVPKDRVPAMTLCMSSTTGVSAGLESPEKCTGNPMAPAQISFHEMLHLCGTGPHTVQNDMTWACTKSCYPKITKGDPKDCECPC